MPLVILCGLPASGKSSRQRELQRYLEETAKIPVIVLSDCVHFGGLSKTELYSSSAAEKNLRAAVKSDIQRSISKETVVIVDTLNYIKGYRYEIWCIAKSSKTPQCMIWCNTPIETAKSWNSSMPIAQQYSPEVYDALVMRFEPPDSQNRWENPLFTVLPEDVLPFNDILASLLNRQPPPPNQSTQSQPLAPVNYLHELDKVTQSITAAILSSQLNGQPGDKIIVPGIVEPVAFGQKVSAPELSRLRRQFISHSRTRPVENLDRIPLVFIEYLKNTVK
ncbi:protein KTI12 homolog [Paramacrobiotus metropolitanus]|uniref:protein KTI12 homolog n=1 Tax=Paramacrobiotus metropolitanus TaxID=2943436 RepID=UPI00244625D0|nr:protein KTI12 homolog [Paramacrobiotus metropolitanus]